MTKRSKWPTVAVLFFLFALITGDREASGSSMVFRFVKTLVFAGSGSVGDNWVSIPYISPYHTAADLCAKTGLPSTGLQGRANIVGTDPNTGASTVVTCGTSPANSMVLVPGRGYRIREPNGPNARQKIVLVGVHDPSLVIQVPQFDGVANGLWFSVPYHTTAITSENLCVQMGTPAVGAVQRMDAATGTLTTAQCGTVFYFTLVPGEAVKLLGHHALSFLPSTY
jgi:hypothetical protein